MLRPRRRGPAVIALLLALAAGCGGGGGSPAPAATAAPVVSAVEEVPDDPDEAAIVGFHARLLEREVGLDAATAARAEALIAARWARVRAEVDARVEAALPLDEEVVSDLLAAHQRALDLELAALLTPAQRDRFLELGGRLDAAPAGPAVTEVAR